MLEDISNLTKLLNRKDILPVGYLRRNSIYYSFVSYINHTIALFIGEDYDDVALFIKRSHSELMKLKVKNECSEEYFSLCEQYLKKLSIYLYKNELLSDFGIEMLHKCYNIILWNDDVILEPIKGSLKH
ncbi:hypothetical protein [Desulfosporosinus sp. SB140]|uniref:hypothetical protein n=1 Tax=Desulfosporosinus paludis TaxID=3115649 RepID=UPI00388DD615